MIIIWPSIVLFTTLFLPILINSLKLSFVVDSARIVLSVTLTECFLYILVVMVVIFVRFFRVQLSVFGFTIQGVLFDELLVCEIRALFGGVGSIVQRILFLLVTPREENAHNLAFDLNGRPGLLKCFLSIIARNKLNKCKVLVSNPPDFLDRTILTHNLTNLIIFGQRSYNGTPQHETFRFVSA